MGLYGYRVTSRQQPVNSQFLDHMHHVFCGSEVVDDGWHDQVREHLTNDKFVDLEQKLEEFHANESCREWLRVAVNCYLAELQGNKRPLADVLEGWEFLFIVGIPRSGGTYLLKEAIRATGQDYRKVHRGFYHDGFPAYQLFRKETGLAHASKSTWDTIQMAIMGRVEAEVRNIRIVPKKLHTLQMEPGLAKRLGGRIYKTHRAVEGVTQSVLDMGGGMPQDGYIPRHRTAIERQVWDMLIHHGYSIDDVRIMPYMGAMKLFHWFYEQEMKSLHGVECQFEDMARHAADIHSLYGSKLKPEEFVCKQRKSSLSSRSVPRVGGLQAVGT